MWPGNQIVKRRIKTREFRKNGKHAANRPRLSVYVYTLNWNFIFESNKSQAPKAAANISTNLAL